MDRAEAQIGGYLDKTERELPVGLLRPIGGRSSGPAALQLSGAHGFSGRQRGGSRWIGVSPIHWVGSTLTARLRRRGSTRSVRRRTAQRAAEFCERLV
jgi:hypothetical protein